MPADRPDRAKSPNWGRKQRLRSRVLGTKQSFFKKICKNKTHGIHVCYIYLHLVDVYGKCLERYNT